MAQMTGLSIKRKFIMRVQLSALEKADIRGQAPEIAMRLKWPK